MKIFVLEDNLERVETFKVWFKGHKLIITDNALIAIEIFKNSLDYDFIFLDHDLGGEVYVNIDEPNTGSTVAKFLSDKQIRGKVIIHSMNYIGADNMKGYLPQAEVIPFHMLVGSIKVGD